MANPQSPFAERFQFQGVKLSVVPDVIPPGKYAAAQNIRSNPGSNSIYTRPGSIQIFTTGGNSITDIRAYATLSTDDNPRFLARDTLNKIWLDNNNTQITLGGNTGFGVSMIPFRPGASPQSYMYIAGVGDYQKLSAPNSTNVTTASNVGIQEPQGECEFGPVAPLFTNWTSNAANWNNSGNAGAASDTTRSNENITTMLADPVVTTRFSVQPANNGAYQVGEILNFLDANNNSIASTIIQEVLPALAAGNAMAVQAIHYDAGNNGFATVVPSQVPVAGETQISFFERGSLLKISQGNNNEAVLILSSTPGPSGGVSLRFSTNNTYSANATLNGIPAIVVDANTASLNNSTHMTATAVNWQVTGGANNTAGNGNLTITPATNPFAVTMGANSTSLPQDDDYIHVSLLIDDPTQIVQVLIMFNVDASDTTFVSNVLYYSVSPGDLVKIASGAVTQLAAILSSSTNANVASQATAIQNQIGQIQAQLQSGLLTPEVAQSQISSLNVQLVNLEQIAAPPGQTEAGSSQWTEVLFPISSLTRIGNDQSRTLANLVAIRIYVQTLNTVNMRLSSCWVGGGGQPDTGDTGAAYQYRCVPRSTTTGAVGNPSPVPVYGVYSRRQQIIVSTPDLTYDPQINVYDIYRYGGTVTSWRYIGTQNQGSNFTDNLFDDSALAGQILIEDNYQPWPSVDVPFMASVAGGQTITLNGTIVIISGMTTVPATILNWLPGTLVQINNLTAYPLWARPVKLSATSYLFKFGQTTGSGTASSFVVQEPIVGRQFQPYVWGPDAQGTLFGCGDPLRPGVLSWTKQNSPDTVSDQDNADLTPPSEPLLGGETTGDGLSWVASTRRWWALYPSSSLTAQAAGGVLGPQYAPVERPVGQGIIAPYGHCTDGTYIYFWAKDGIARHSGGPFESLTDEDLYPLFPHDGVAGINIIRNACTFYAPDYSRAAQFRLAFAKSYLYAIYPDSNGTYRTLVCDTRVKAWSSDSYATAVSAVYSAEQQSGSLLTAGNSYPSLLFGLTNGNVNKQYPQINDNWISVASNGTAISCVVQTREWDGGQQPVNGLWRDIYIDAWAPNGYNAQPVVLNGNANGSSVTTIAANNNSRSFQQIVNNNGTVERFLGVQVNWTDSF